MKFKSLVIFASVFIFFVSTANVSAKYSGGTGEPNDPYIIATAQDLIGMGNRDDINKYFILDANIDLSEYTFDRAIISYFHGTFDGNNHTISSLKIEGTDRLGLFGVLYEDAEISNLILKEIDVNGIGNYVGTIAGKNHGIITSCFSTGKVSGCDNTSGLVGINHGTIISCCSTGTVSGINQVGGLVGTNNGSIEQCYSISTVSGNIQSSGLVGNNNNGNIMSCYSMGIVNGEDLVGGIAGSNFNGNITSSYSTCQINGESRAGGLLGSNGSIRAGFGTITSSFWDIEASEISTSDGGIGKTSDQMYDINTYLDEGWDFIGETDNGTEDTWRFNKSADYPRLCWEQVPIKYSGGSGTIDEPYIIATAQDLIDLGNELNHYDNHFIQDANIDLSEYLFDSALIAWDTNPDETGFQGTPFAGTFDGNGYVIFNLNVKSKDYLGMFGKIGSQAILSNISLEEVNIQKGRFSDCSNVGALAGHNEGTILQCYSIGVVNGNNASEYVGGLIGKNLGNISSSFSTCIVTGYDYIGGLTGDNSGKITSSYSTCKVNGADYAAGLVGYNSGNIESCDNFSEVNGDYYIGGLAGYNSGNITLCCNTGIVNGALYTGGLVGYNSLNIISSYSTGTVSGNDSTGGLVGINDFNIISSYSTGTVDGGSRIAGGLVGRNSGNIFSSYSNGAVTGDENTGGLIGSNGGWVGGTGSLSSSFWDTQTSGQSTSSGGIGLTTEQMQNANTYSDWDCIDEQNNGTWDFWYIQEGTYPQLAGFLGYELRELQGSGTTNDPYLIYDANDLGTVCYHPAANYRLEADVNLSGITWKQPVVPYFAANFDGNQHTIKSLHIEGSGNLGLFGKVGPNAEISNLTLEDANVNGTGGNVGAIAGQNYGCIKSSYITGIVNGDNSIGGLVGSNLGYIVSSRTMSQINGKNNIGTLAGTNYGSIISCYCSGSVSGDGYIGGITAINGGSIISSFSNSSVQVLSRRMQGNGGLVGNNIGSITSCYYTGIINKNVHAGGLAGINSGSITLSFWDTQTSGLSTSEGGIGKTTAEMQDISTYLNAGWDFVDEQINGTCNFWCFEEENYPQLATFSGYEIQEPEGSGTPESPYLIDDINDLGTIWYYPKAHYSMETDIDLSYIKWNNSIIPWFGGNFDGNNHKIFSLNIDGGGHLGLFGSVAKNAEVSNISIESGYIKGTGDYIGGLIGYNSGNVLLCSFTGQISGRDYTGGLIGYNIFGDINSCFSIGIVSGNDNIGGLLGYHDSENIKEQSNINTSYSRCMVTGNQNVGGLLGSNYLGIINSSYSSSKVNGQNRVGGLVGYVGRGSTAISCFWDIETSGLDTIDGAGTGLTTAQMKDINTYMFEGWDFIGETINGTQDIWWIDFGKDYPRLWWELEEEN